MLYNQLDSLGAVTRSGFKLTPFDRLPEGSSWVEHVPSASDIAEKAAVIAAHEEVEASRVSAKAIAVIQYLATHTPAECEAYIKASVTNLSTAVDILSKFSIALCISQEGIPLNCINVTRHNRHKVFCCGNIADIGISAQPLPYIMAYREPLAWNI